MGKKRSIEQDTELWRLLAQTRQAMLKARMRELHRYNIPSAMQAHASFVIHTLGDKATPTEIGRWLLREPNSVSELLSRLENEGLVRKIRDFGKKNTLRVVLTEKGRETYYQSMKRESIGKIMSSLSDEQYQQLRSCLLKLRRKALKEIGMNNKIPF
jgi:DNA-binding MarR family transcriptional regulator